MAFVQVTPALLATAVAATDRDAVDAQTDPDIAHNVAGDADAAPILTGGQTAVAIARTVRKHLGLSQADVAARFHLPVGTLRDWEQNRRQPDAPALAYLRVIAREPDMVARALAAACAARRVIGQTMASWPVLMPVKYGKKKINHKGTKITKESRRRQPRPAIPDQISESIASAGAQKRSVGS